MPIVYMENLQTVELDDNYVTSLDCLTEMQTIPAIELISLKGNIPKLETYRRLVPRDPLELVCEFYRQQFKRKEETINTPAKYHQGQQQFYCQ